MEIRRELITENIHKVETWQNGLGLQWDLYTLPDGNFLRIMWGNKLKGNNEREEYPSFWADKGTDIKWPEIREAKPEEVANFAMLALEQMPNSDLAKKMAKSAVSWLKVRADNLERQANKISSSLQEVDTN